MELSGIDLWLVMGLLAQGVFSARFVVQWIASEKRGESYIPVVFWYLSLAGGSMLLVYAINLGDPVFIIGQSTGVFIYLRNIFLVKRKKLSSVVKPTDDQTPQA